VGRVSRIAATAVGAALVTAVAAGCGGPSQVTSAVIVGDRAVDLAAVQTRIDGALGAKSALSTLVGQQVDDQALARYVVSAEVRHEMIDSAAAREGVVVGESDVDAAVADESSQGLAIDRTLFAGEDLRDRARDRLLAIGLARKDIAGLAVTADLVVATSEQDAQQKARTIAEGGPAAEALLADPRNAQRGTYRATSDPDTATTVLFGMLPGATAAFEPSPGQGVWLVAHVVDRTQAASPAADGAPAAVDDDTLAAIGARLAQPEAGEIRLNPRFGVWDEIALQVVPADKRSGEITQPA
jgi:hypothetical protein